MSAAPALREVKDERAAPPADAGLQGERYVDARARVLRDFSRAYLARLLAEADGCVSAAARAAGLDRSNFKRLLVRYRVGRPEQAGGDHV